MNIQKKDTSFLLLILIIVILVFGIIFSLLTFRSNPVGDAVADNRVINTLYVIEDNRTPLSTFVLMYYPATKRAAVFDIPGDLGLLISRINRVDRIDRIYEPARISAYQNEIEKLLGIDINFSVIITNENLVSVVDLLEGIEIFIPSPVYYWEGDKIILFPSGMTVLDGDKADLYATYRLPYEESEVEISRRQRLFLGILSRQIQMNENFKNPDAAKMYYSLFRTSMNQRTFSRLLDEFANMDIERINIQSVGGNVQEVTGQRLVIPHFDGNLIKEIVRQTLGTLTSDIEDYLIERALTVEVLNGTTVTGLAGRTRELLESFGYNIVSVGNADKNDYESTVIIHRSGDQRLVNDFAEIIRCTNIVRELTAFDEMENEFLIFGETQADITLLIGRNFNGRYVTGNQ